MKKLLCRDVSGWDCPYEAEGDTDEEVKMKLAEHGEEVHPEEMAAMSDEDKAEMQQKIEEHLAEQE